MQNIFFLNRVCIYIHIPYYTYSLPSSILFPFQLQFTYPIRSFFHFVTSNTNTKSKMEKFQCTIMFASLLMSTTIFSSLPIQSHATKHFNVLSFGAKPNGIVDSAAAFAKAWDAACSSTEAAVIYVSKGRYLVSPVRFSGESCKSLDIVFRIDGTLVGSGDYNFLGREETWFSFERVTGVSVIGGSFDAKGPSLWACKASSNNSCPAGATV